MRAPRWYRWYPKSWRDRYGEEYEQLLDDLGAEHHLSSRELFDVARTGIALHHSTPDGRRRLHVVAVTVVVLGLGIGLGIGLPIGTGTSATYVAPPLPATPPSGGTVLSVASSGMGQCFESAQVIVGRKLGPSGLHERYTSIPPMFTVFSGRTKGLTWSVVAPAASPAHPSMLERVEAGAVGIDGHFYALCPLFLRSPNAPTSSSVPPAPHISAALVGDRDIAYGLVPTSTTKLSFAFDESRFEVSTVVTNLGAYSLVLGTLPDHSCEVGLVTVAYTVVTPAAAWTGDVQPHDVGCIPGYEGTPSPGIGSSGTQPILRNAGIVASVTSGSMEVSTRYWPSLHVAIPTSAEILVSRSYGPTGQGWAKATTASLKRCDEVYVAGTISPKTAVASRIYVEPQLDVPSCDQPGSLILNHQWP